MKITPSFRFGLVVCGLGALVACQPVSDDADIDTEDGVDPQCYLTGTCPGGDMGGVVEVEDPTAGSSSGGSTTTTTTTTTTTKTGGGGLRTPTVPISKCAPVDVTAFYDQGSPWSGKGAMWPANTRLSPVVNGTVACLEAESMKAATCKWAPASGRYAQGKGGIYAQAGQLISQGGVAGGKAASRFVVASPVVRNTVPCYMPIKRLGKDSAGVPVSGELSAACVVEAGNSIVNVTGKPHQNYADLYVCGMRDKDTSDATVTEATSPSADVDGYERGAGVTCYQGLGAGINDIFGTERDEYQQYIPGPEACHVTWQGALEVPAAKRPSTGGWPSKPLEWTAIRWLPVVSYVTIANKN